MLTAHLIVVLLTQTPDLSLGDVGESCRARSDCRSGLKCVNATCTAPAVAAPVVAPSKEGHACEASAECSSDGSLRCVAKVCVLRGGSSSTANAFSPPPLPPTNYAPSSARLVEAPAAPTRSASLTGGQTSAPIASVGGNLSLAQHISQLEADIDGFNAQLRGVDTGWPGGSIALVVIGSVLSPLALVGLILLVVPVVGIPVLLIGLGGVAMIVVGAVGGTRVAAEANAQRESLIQQRSAAERELANLKRMAAVSNRAESAMITVASF